MNPNASLIKALSDCIPCLRDQPEFTSELRQAARALMEHGVTYVCNGDLTDDLNTAWTDAERARERTYLFVSVGPRGGRKVVGHVFANLNEANVLFDREFESGKYLTLELYADSDEPENLCSAFSIKEHVA